LRNLFSRDDVLKRLRECISRGEPIVGAGAGTGISAKFEERGGADLMLVYNSGRYRMAGHGSLAGLLAIGDANAVVIEMGEREILPVVQNTPVIAGVNGTDPTRLMRRFLRQVEETGFSGVINFPSHGVIDGKWRQSLEETGFGYDREVAMLATAAELGLFTMAYVFNDDDARSVTEVGVDVVVAHMGLTVGGTIGAAASSSLTLDEAATLTEQIADAARSVREDIIVLCHGGPLETPDEVAYVVQRTSVVGFIGASSMERVPIERPLEEITRSFKEIRVKP
jgi:predicted TIM-barrel enzyme